MMYDGIVLKPPLDDALEHYGVKGMKWGRRKKKEVKAKARRYQKEINKRLATENAMFLKYWNLHSGKDGDTWLINTLTKKNKHGKLRDKAVKKLKARNDLRNKNLSILEKEYKVNRKKIDALKEKIAKDPELLYTVGYGYKMDTKYYDSFTRKYGYATPYAQGRRSVSGSKYKVVPYSERRAKMKKYSDKKRKKEKLHYRSEVKVPAEALLTMLY